MIIPNKFSGFHNGVRRCFGGGGGGGAGGDGGTGDAASAAGGGVGPGASGTGNGTGDGGGGGGSGPGGDAGGGNTVYTPPGNVVNTGVNTNRGNVTGMNFTGGNTAGTSTIPSNNLNLQNMYGKPYNQSGQQYNALLQQGYTGNDIRNALTTNGRPVSDSDYGYLVQNAGMTSPTSRPYAGSDQFFQPVYNSSYQNYARPATQFNVSSYGTQPSNSPAFNSGMSRGAINQSLNNFYNTNYRDNPNGVGMGDTLDFMRQNGINRDDFQTWGGVNNYGPQTSAPSMQTQMQQQFNPYSNNSGFNGQLMTAGYGGFGSPMGGLSPFVTNPMYQMQQPYNPFSYQQQNYQPQMQTPFSYQPSYQPSYGGYNSYGQDFGGGVNMYTPVTQQPTPQRTSSGPTTPIVGRSAGFRGTPNVMRRAEGGIASLMDDVE